VTFTSDGEDKDSNFLCNGEDTVLGKRNRGQLHKC